jgi:hypothetical protein
MEEKDLSKGLRALTVESERVEVLAALNGGSPMCMTNSKQPLKLQYLKGSAKMGLRLWNVISPQVDGYTYGPDSGVPTFSLETLKAKGLLKWF